MPKGYSDTLSVSGTVEVADLKENTVKIMTIERAIQLLGLERTNDSKNKITAAAEQNILVRGRYRFSKVKGVQGKPSKYTVNTWDNTPGKVPAMQSTTEIVTVNLNKGFIGAYKS